MDEAECAFVSGTYAEPLSATAPAKYASWIAIEHPGPWPVSDPWRILPERAVTVCEAADTRGIEVVLIRRTRRRRRTPPHQVFISSNAGDGPAWLESVELADPDALDALDLDALAAGRRTRLGELSDERPLLVCTHGQRDRCCARYGRPVADALAKRHGPLVWEATHVGGHRFAANVVCLPDATYHGRLGRANAELVAESCLRGEVVLPFYRGRAGLPAEVQAAEHALRVHLGETRVAAISVVQAEPGRVRLAADGAEYAFAVRSETGRPALSSCGDDVMVPQTHHVAELLSPVHS